jgi:hypothetical protein
MFAVLPCVGQRATSGGARRSPACRVAILAVAEEEIDGLQEAALGDDIVALSRDIDWLRAERGRRLARFARRRGRVPWPRRGLCGGKAPNCSNSSRSL